MVALLPLGGGRVDSGQYLDHNRSDPHTYTSLRASSGEVGSSVTTTSGIYALASTKPFADSPWRQASAPGSARKTASIFVVARLAETLVAAGFEASRANPSPGRFEL
jgi:hypothetical protein